MARLAAGCKGGVWEQFEAVGAGNEVQSRVGSARGTAAGAGARPWPEAASGVGGDKADDAAAEGRTRRSY